MTRKAKHCVLVNVLKFRWVNTNEPKIVRHFLTSVILSKIVVSRAGTCGGLATGPLSHVHDEKTKIVVRAKQLTKAPPLIFGVFFWLVDAPLSFQIDHRVYLHSSRNCPKSRASALKSRFNVRHSSAKSE